MSSFSDLLADYVEELERRTGMKRKEIANKADYSPSMFPHLLSGRRSLGDRNSVLSLCRKLDFTLQETNNLLLAADFAPLTKQEIELEAPAIEKLQQQVASQTVGDLETPEQEVLTAMVESDIKIVASAWSSYVGLRRALYERKWSDVAERAQRDIDEWYWLLRRVAARFLAYQLLAKQLHRGT